jgi:hypothetical protein
MRTNNNSVYASNSLNITIILDQSTVYMSKKLFKTILILINWLHNEIQFNYVIESDNHDHIFTPDQGNKKYGALDHI